MKVAPRIHMNHRLTGRTRHRFERLESRRWFSRTAHSFVVLQVEVEFDVCTPGQGAQWHVERTDKQWRDARADDFLCEIETLLKPSKRHAAA